VALLPEPYCQGIPPLSGLLRQQPILGARGLRRSQRPGTGLRGPGGEPLAASPAAGPGVSGDGIANGPGVGPLPIQPSPEPSLMGADLLLETYLKRLRLPTVADNYRRFAQEAAHDNQPYERFLPALLEAEVHRQEANSERKRIAQARFPVLKTLDEFQFTAIPSLNRQAILELAQGHYIQAQENVVFLGPTGTGKTHPSVRTPRY